MRQFDELTGKVFLQEQLIVPTSLYPGYNFVGRILGPRGNTVRQIEETTGCRIMVRGRGSTRGSARDPNRTMSSSWASTPDDEPLHIIVQCEDYEFEADRKMTLALYNLTQLLFPLPDGKDDLKRRQLVELSIINGTYRHQPQ